MMYKHIVMKHVSTVNRADLKIYSFEAEEYRLRTDNNMVSPYNNRC